jgi:agmatinase
MKLLSKLLTLPGNGVMTVNTARAKKEKLLRSYYRTADPVRAEQLWQRSLENLTTDKPWLIGIPSDNGGGIQRGANWGPLAIREQLTQERKSFVDLGDVKVIPHLLHDRYLNAETIAHCQRALYGRINKLPVSPLSICEAATTEIYRRHPEARLLGLGGDHSISLPLVLAWLRSRKQLAKAALLHFDAHTDLMDRRFGIDYCFGTWTYHVLDELASRDHLLQVGIRSSAKTKKHWKDKLGVEQIWAREAIRSGPEKTFRKIEAHFKKLGVEEIYLSFDFDALDIKYAAATGTPEAEGLLPPDCAYLIRKLSRSFKITGADLMEVAPHVIPEGVSITDQVASLNVAGELARLLLGALSESQ